MSSAEQRGLSPANSFPNLNQTSFARSPEPQGTERTPTPHAIDLHIDELVLHGFARSDRDRIGAAIQQELTRLFTEQGIPPTLAQGQPIEQLNGGTFKVTTGIKPEVAGIQIAQSIYGGLGE